MEVDLALQVQRRVAQGNDGALAVAVLVHCDAAPLGHYLCLAQQFGQAGRDSALPDNGPFGLRALRRQFGNVVCRERRGQHAILVDLQLGIVVNEDVKKVIRECFDLGPLHNPANLMGIEACEAAMPGKANVAVFDTSFGMGMEEKAYLYAIPYEYYEKYKVRRYGFHGTSHMFVSREAIKFGKLDPKKAKVIVCHLGNGASVSASIGGKCVDTSMGLAPLEGVIMGTRSGDVDPTILQFICNHEKIDVNQMLNILNKKSGILGMSGVSSDFRDVGKAAAEGNKRAQVGLDAYDYRIAKYIGAYTAAMNGVDAICFTAGVGENDKDCRKRICAYLGYLGVKIDDERNNIRGEERVISADDSKVKVMLIPTNEELAIARETLALTTK